MTSYLEASFFLWNNDRGCICPFQNPRHSCHILESMGNSKCNSDCTDWHSPGLWLDTWLPCLTTKRLTSSLSALSSHLNGSRTINPVAIAIVWAARQQPPRSHRGNRCIKSLNLCSLEWIWWMQTANSPAPHTSDLPPETNFSREVQSLTLKFSTATVELPPLLSQIGTHTDGMGGGFEPEMKRRVNREAGTKPALASYVPQKCSTPICVARPKVPRPKHSGRPMTGPKLAAIALDSETTQLATPLPNTVAGPFAHSFQRIQHFICCNFFLPSTLCQDPNTHPIRISYEVIIILLLCSSKAVSDCCHHRNVSCFSPLPLRMSTEGTLATRQENYTKEARHLWFLPQSPQKQYSF